MLPNDVVIHRHFRVFCFCFLLFALAACISTSSEPEIVSTRVVSPLAPTPTVVIPTSFDLQAGADLYANNCVQCHGEQGLGDGPASSGFDCPLPQFPERSADITLAEWFNIVYNGKRSPEFEFCLMPNWNQRLSEAETWNVTAYAYSMAPGGVEAVAQANTSSPDETEEPSESQTQAGTPAPLTPVSTPTEIEQIAAPEETQDADVTPMSTDSQESAASAVPSDTFTLRGVVINATDGGLLPLSLTLDVSLYTVVDGQVQESYNAQTQMRPDGSFEFADLSLAPSGLLVTTEYAGVRQTSNLILVPAEIEGNAHTLEFPIYEVTTDVSQIVLARSESLVDAVTEEGAALIYQTFEYANLGDRIYIGSEGVSVEIPFPEGILEGNIQIGGDSYRAIEDNGVTHYWSTDPVPPGNNRLTIQVAYGWPYDGSMDIVQYFPFAVQQAFVYVAEQNNLRLSSEQLVPAAPYSEQGIFYNGYSITQPLQVGQSLTYRIFDGPRLPSTASESQSDQNESSSIKDNSTLIFGVGVLLIIAGGMYLLYDLQKTRLLMQMPRQNLVTKSKDELLAEIVALDEAHARGELSEEDYKEQRERLKEALRPYFN